ncbi:MAG: hypothetical protein FWD99_07260 [Oscillospiraceae bacterium]|nr:hypothetical protein [Oscillospiraceae bacterium]
MRIYINDLSPEMLERAEALLYSGNGFIGIRGCLEEAYYDHFSTNRESYINGFYETRTISYPEKHFGFPATGETMISVIDGQTTLIHIGGEPVSLHSGEITDHTRYLDMEQGVVVRKFLFVSPAGRKTRIKITRLASFVHKNIFAMHYEFERLNHHAPIELITHLNYYPTRTVDKDDPRMHHDIVKLHVERIEQRNAGAEFDVVHFNAPNSGKTASFFWHLSEETKREILDDKIVLKTQLTDTHFTKTFAYTLGNREITGFNLSFEEHLRLQREFLDSFWQVARIEIDAQENIEESVNFGTFALLQSLGTDGQSIISAKGLSGSGYEGHYFWDCELYIFPTFLHFAPHLAREILRYRINTLEQARANGKNFGYTTGALYPWRTISGIESSAFFEAGSAQHHINSDIAYAFIRYYESTRDSSIFFDGGFAVLLETARFLAAVGHVRDDQFHIDKVTGPDEYTVLVNDNYYTNLMAAYHFRWVNQLACILQAENPTGWDNLSAHLTLTQGELDQLSWYADHMALPFDENQQIIAQDRDFLNKAPWPFWHEEKYPLLLHYHPITIYRYQVAKQADAVLALMLFPDAVSPDVAENTVRYYDAITTHDSSLSYSAFSVVYNRIGDTAKSYDYFVKNARCDLDNLHKNTKDGLHLASIGGTLMNILYGFCDLRFSQDGFTLNPRLPDEINAIRFSMVYHGKTHRISVTKDGYEIG